MNTIETRPTERQTQMQRGLLVLFPLALLTLGPVASLAETAESFDCPDSFFTEPRSINDRGDIVGICDGQYAFLLRNGVFKRIDGPEGAGLTAAFGVNNRGDVVGRYDDAEGVTHGYLLRRGHYTTIDPPGSILTVPRGIDDRGRIVGDYRGSDGVLRGFVLDARGYRDIEFPGSDQTAARGINVRTQIVGGYNRFHGFILKNGVFTRSIVRAPQARAHMGPTSSVTSSASGAATPNVLTASRTRSCSQRRDSRTSSFQLRRKLWLLASTPEARLSAVISDRTKWCTGMC